MLIYPSCKINIGLKVLDKHKDGFHNLESVFVPVSWCDALEIVENKNISSSKITFTASGLKIKGEAENNLCVKAYRLLDLEFKLPSIKMHLHKIIPMGAGLGGGSSDGAFTLKLLNELFKLKLSDTRLQKYAEKLGSDCPFFINNDPAFVSGRGEKLAKIDVNLKGLTLVIVHPQIHISTADAYNNIIKTKYKYPLKELPKLKIETWPNKVDNDFEGYALSQYPQLKKIKESLYKKGALYASMSGSGSALYGLFEKKIKIPKAWEKFAVFQSSL